MLSPKHEIRNTKLAQNFKLIYRRVLVSSFEFRVSSLRLKGAVYANF